MEIGDLNLHTMRLAAAYQLGGLVMVLALKKKKVIFMKPFLFK
jgi:hypothetical protein